jgi:CubicO group peptidase (beta-lactamase class C family)
LTRSTLLPSLALSLLGLVCGGCVYSRIVYYNLPTLDAPRYFDNRVVSASPAPLPLPRSSREATFRLTDSECKHHRSFDAFLEAAETRAFLVIVDDAIVYERYFHGVSPATQLPAFSLTKSVSAVLVGRAVSQGLVSLDRSIVDYVPELAAKPGYRDVTLEHLLRMISGIDFEEQSIEGAKLYYTTDLHGYLYAYRVVNPPGTRYRYGSINMQLFWDALRRRLHEETVTQYFQEQVWAPLGAEHDASWSLDSRASGIEKFFAGFNATLRDYARLGMLFLHGGFIGGRRILPREWVERALSPDPIAGRVHTTDGWVARGHYQWFLTRDGRAYFAKGYKGQYVFVVPDRHAVFVRFGEGYGDVDWTSLFLRLADAMAAEKAPAAPGAHQDRVSTEASAKLLQPGFGL